MLLLRQAAVSPGSAQLQKQRYSCPRLRAHQAIPVLRSVAASSSDASKAANVNASRVKAAFAEAGLSQDAIDYILTQYPAYLRWDVEQKLLPSMHQKQQELGAEFPCALRKTPKMLLRSTGIMSKAQSARKAAKAKAASRNALNVTAAFAAAGLSQDAVKHILTRYPYYLRWDVEQKLLPAIQSWRQELGGCFLSQFERVPTLLLAKPEAENEKDAYLMSVGVTSPRRLRQRQSTVFQQSLISLQGRVAFLQHCGFTTAQTLSLIEQHSGILQCSSEHVEELLRTIGDMFGCEDKETLCDVILSCRRMGVFTRCPTFLHHNFTYFCTCIGVDDKEMKRAWKHGVFGASPAELDTRLDSIAAQLDATLDEAKSIVRRHPEISTLLPATVALHVTQLHDLGFSIHQVKSMCLQQPTLLTLSYNSQLQADKWAFFSCVLQLSHACIAAKPYIFGLSLPNRLGPRWAYLQQLRLHGLIAFTTAPQVFQSLLVLTDTQFRARHTARGLSSYDEQFQKQWQKQWKSLLVDQQLSIQDIADNPALLHIPLTDPIAFVDG